MTRSAEWAQNKRLTASISWEISCTVHPGVGATQLMIHTCTTFFFEIFLLRSVADQELALWNLVKDATPSGRASSVGEPQEIPM